MTRSVQSPHPTPRLFRFVWILAKRLPPRLGFIRVAILSWFGASIGSNVVLGPGVIVLGVKGLNISDGVAIARDVVLDARAGIHLGSDVVIGFESLLLTWTHRWEDPGLSVMAQGFEGGSIGIGERTWIGARVIILPGRSIGRSSMVGAGSVVTHEFGDGVIVAGNPAQFVRDR